jgi:hypothetical protein
VVAFASILVAFMSLNASATADLQFVGAFPVYRGLFLLALQAWLWGVVVWVCEAHHINYVFVLNADTRTALRHQHALMVRSRHNVGALLIWCFCQCGKTCLCDASCD